jgi:hypothetical protein
MTKTLMHLMIVAGMLSSAGAQAIAIKVDGNLSDWGVKSGSQSTKSLSDWTPLDGIYSTIEDQHGSGRLDAGWGDQLYDAEALYVYLDRDADLLYIALATGHNPETKNINGNYGAGDFAIDFGKNGSYEVGINIQPIWDGFGVASGVYQTTSTNWSYGIWNDGVIPGFVNSEHPTSLIGGKKIGDAEELFINKNGQTKIGPWSGDTHYFYEMSLSTTLLTSAGWKGESFNVHWTMNCANDTIITDPPAAAVPEPGTLALLPLGLLSLLALRRRKTR